MITLYTMPGACSLADHIGFIWADIPFNIEIVEYDKLSSPEFLKINSSGAVPVLKKDNWILTQNMGIMHYIIESSKGVNVGPSESIEKRAEFYSLLGYLNSDFHGTFFPLFAPAALGVSEAEFDNLKKAGEARLRSHLERVNKKLEGVNYLYENRKTMADAYLFVMLIWVNSLMKGEIDKYPNLKAFFGRMSTDEGVQKAMKAEGLTK